MPTKQIKDLTKLDSQLEKIERQFSKKLESYYSNIESDALKQITKIKKGDGFNIPESRQKGLQNLLNGHFKNIEKLSTEYTKVELSDLTNSKSELEKIRLLTPARVNKSNVEYARQLSEKQVSDYQKNIESKLSEALKDNPKLSVKELKDLVKHETQSFKNTRTKATSSTEANRVTNETKLNIYKKMGISKVKFIATLDRRTSDFCIAHDSRIYAIGTEPKLPNHINCRSYYIAVKEESKVINNV